ncbi:MAG: hypothetical protein GF329_07005 [Candidatus Lokiarchaeota archaeon]|nr:hypothetical protein [Candidatus Lokiarchaeota archaeon]
MKKKIIILILFNILIFGVISMANADTDLPPDGFSQRPNDIYIWEVEVSEGEIDDYIWGNIGDQITIIITNISLEYTGICWWGHSLLGEIFFYNNSQEESTNLFGEDTLLIYNSTMGCKFLDRPLFIPHNETAVNASLNELYLNWKLFEHYSWGSGSNGYDGTYSAYNGSSSGDLGELKVLWDFNQRGEASTYEVYNGTGNGWELIFKISLIFSSPDHFSQPSTAPIPGFNFILGFFAINAIIILLLLFRKKNK